VSSGVWLAVVLLALLAARAVWRSHRELVAWLGVDRELTGRVLRAVLLVGSAAFASAALVRTADAPPVLRGAGADVVLALDVSRSMNARDAAPTRLQRAVRQAEGFATTVEGTRVGLVLFAGAAYTALPLSLDRDAQLAYLGAIDDDLISQRGSDLAVALRRAGEVFDPGSDRPRSVLLFSDGEHSGPAVEPVLDELAARGVRVFPIGFGTLRGDFVPGPEGTPIRDQAGREVVSKRGDALLERIASRTGGRYLRDAEDRPDAAALRALVSARVAPPVAASGAWTRALIALALGLLAAELLLDAAPGRQRGALGAAAASLALLGAGGSLLAEGDAQLARGEPRRALALYRRAENAQGVSADSELRSGNALYRLGNFDAAAASYLEALRRLSDADSDARFAASFNLGNALLATERYVEARDAFWSALLVRPASVEAKFNYEWATELVKEEPEAEGPETREATQVAPGAAEGQSGREGERAGARATLDAEEAERWLGALEDSLERPLRQQIADELGPARPLDADQQTW